MCGSENELIHDARQVDLEDVIMTNETPMYLVPGRLTDEQSTAIRRQMIDGPILDPSDMFARMVGIIGTPIQPCADVENVGWGRETSFVDIKAPGCHAVSIHKEWEGGIPLVRRTDMEAQVAKVTAEKDADIARLSAALKGMTEIAISRASAQTVETMVDEHTSALRDSIVNAVCDLAGGVDSSVVSRNLRTALHKGSAA